MSAVSQRIALSAATPGRASISIALQNVTLAHLPAGLAPRPPAMPFPEPPFSPAPPRPACTQLFLSPGSGWLTVTQLYGAVMAAQLRAAAAGPWRAVQVRGHRGWLADGSLTWDEGDQSILIQAGLPFPTARARDAGLLAIARSLR